MVNDITTIPSSLFEGWTIDVATKSNLKFMGINGGSDIWWLCLISKFLYRLLALVITHCLQLFYREDIICDPYSFAKNKTEIVYEVKITFFADVKHKNLYIDVSQQIIATFAVSAIYYICNKWFVQRKKLCWNVCFTSKR